MYTKQFDIRWRDLDANGHLGNSSYVDFMSHTRMSFFNEIGIS
ncbi:MAG: thioesterase, partial [Bacteroidia bacterium]|nr:thioesterase [Bacteroidia bacterium]